MDTTNYNFILFKLGEYGIFMNVYYKKKAKVIDIKHITFFLLY